MTNSSPTSPDKPAAPAMPVGPHSQFWLRELPYVAALALMLIGVAYTSFAKHPVIAYWELLAPVIAIICISAGWRRAPDKEARLRLVWTQAVHWVAFLIAMNLVLLPKVRGILKQDATGLVIVALLALGTFVAGVHIPAWRVCLLGLIMALCVPVILWIEESTIVAVLAVVVLVVIAGAFWWIGSRNHSATPSRAPGTP
jgi:hypothetical protein